MITSDKLFVEKLNRLIDNNLDNPAFTVDAICQSLGISRSQLHRTVKEQADLSTSLYIRRRRLLRARHLLITTDLRISEIGDAVGITNPQNFSTYFIDEFKASPTEFRKQKARPPAVSQPLPSLETTPDIPPLPDLPTENLPVRFRFLSRRGLVYASIIAGLLLIIGAGLYGRYKNQIASRTNEPVGNSLAVLPFTNLGTADSNPACESIMDAVHRSVSRINNLKVISRSSSDQYKDADKSIWQIGDELQVANILKGSVLKTGNQIQVKVDIIGTQDDILRWSHTYNAPYTDIFTLTDQIVQDVAPQLKLTINAPTSEQVALAPPTRSAGAGDARFPAGPIRPAAERSPTERSPTERSPTPARTPNIDAYNALLQGRQLLVSRQDADLRAGITRFDRALALDSTFAEAYANKAVAWHLLIGSKKTDTQTINRLTEENALKAIRLDPANSTAYGVLGSMYYSTYQWQASENAFRIALQHNPNDAQANYWYSLLLRTMGRLNEAVLYSAQAIALDPLHPVMMAGHIANCTYAGRFDLARAGIETSRVLFDKSFAYQWAKANYWTVRANYGRAIAAYQQAQLLNPDDKGQTPIIMYCEAKQGNRAKAIRFLRELTATTARSDYERAVVYAGLSQNDSSLYYLKKAADGGYLYRDTKVIPVFRSYHAHPVFRAVLRRYNLPEE